MASGIISNEVMAGGIISNEVMAGGIISNEVMADDIISNDVIPYGFHQGHVLLHPPFHCLVSTISRHYRFAYEDICHSSRRHHHCRCCFKAAVILHIPSCIKLALPQRTHTKKGYHASKFASNKLRLKGLKLVNRHSTVTGFPSPLLL